MHTPHRLLTIITRNTTPAVAVAIMALLALAVACAGDDTESEPVVDTDIPISCSALDSLSSYRYNVAVEIPPTGETPNVSAPTGSPTPTAEPQTAIVTDTPAPTTAASDTATPVPRVESAPPTDTPAPPPAETPPATEPVASASPQPLTAFAAALADLFADFSLDGAYVAPDRSQAVLKFQAEELELRVIGGRSWVRTGDEWQEDETSADEVLTPVVVCNEVIQAVRPSLRAGEPARASVNGVTTRHYELDPAKTQNLPPLLGQELAGSYTVDVWVAEDGHWPARFQVVSAEPGKEDTFRLAMDVRDVNDTGIRVEAP